MPIKTPRLMLRPFMSGDGQMINQAILESFDQLTQWMPWADQKPTIEETEIMVRQFYAQWILRENLSMVILDSTGKKLIGCSGFNEIDWKVPKLQIGYWIRSSYTGQGFATETANALTRYAFQELQIARLEINSDEKNSASRKVIEKLNYNFEGVIKHNRFYPKTNPPGSTVVYARYDLVNLPPLQVTW